MCNLLPRIALRPLTRSALHPGLSTNQPYQALRINKLNAVSLLPLRSLERHSQKAPSPSQGEGRGEGRPPSITPSNRLNKLLNIYCRAIHSRMRVRKIDIGIDPSANT